MVAKILWELGSVIPMIIGIMHLRGALFTDELHPTNKEIINQMKTTPLKVDPNALLWKAWIGFNAAFSICVFFMGFYNLYLAYSNFQLVKGVTVLSIASLLALVFLIIIAIKYLIRPVVSAFSIAFVLYLASVIVSLW